MKLLDKISSPADLKKLDIGELPSLCEEIREYLVSCCAVNPGHLGSSLGAVEIAVALHYVYDAPQDAIVWDVGHQAYAHKIITGRREAFLMNRKLGGISGFPCRSESEYDAFGGGHSSTSISAALGYAVEAALNGRKRKCVAVIGDGAMTGGLAFEGLNNAGAMKTDLLVVLNDNHISIDKNIGALHNYLLRMTTSVTYNRLKKSLWNRIGASALRNRIQRLVKNLKNTFIESSSGSLFHSLGFRYFGPVDGNDVVALVSVLRRLRSMDGPRMLHIITTKGKGFPAAEEDQTTWHAPGMFDPCTGRRIAPAAKESRFQDVFGETLLELARTDSRIVGVTPAMASGCGMNLLMKEMPDRCFDVGIAEGHAVTFSAGLAAAGMLPFCNIYSSFSQRAYDNIAHDVLLQGLKVVFCLDRSGLVGEDGATHHGMLDTAMLRAVPGITLCSPMDEAELRNMMYSAMSPQWGAVAIRYPRGGSGTGVEWRHMPFCAIEPGKARKLSSGTGIAVLSYGPSGNAAARAVSRIAEETGDQLLHYDMRFVKPLDMDAVNDVMSSCSVIVTVEDENEYGGLFSAVSECVAGSGRGIRVIPVGVADRFVGQGSQKELRKLCGLDEDSIYGLLAELKKSKKSQESFANIKNSSTFAIPIGKQC